MHQEIKKSPPLFKIFFFILLSLIYSNCYSQQNFVSLLDASREKNIPIDKQLKILSWNIKMFPGPYGWYLNPHERADNIIQFLKESNGYDMIFFQEAFSDNIRRKIYAGLKNIYPHEIEPEDKTAFYKINSGLWVISRLHLTLKKHISFTHLRKLDKLSSKGAKLFSFKKDEQEFHLIHTHMQADYKTIYSDVRAHQYMEIYDQLILPYAKGGLPVILIGDLNISHPSKLKRMLQKLKLVNGPLMGTLQHSIIDRSNKLMDYILVSEHHSNFKSIKRRIIDFSNKLKGKEYNLSDHYPIEAVISW